MKTELIRKKWPKIRIVEIKGSRFYRVDARKTGTSGKQETFKLLKDAEDRAAELEKDYSKNGSEALEFPAELRGMALTAARLLNPFDKTIIQAAEFYKAHLEEVQKRQNSAVVSTLAKAWYDDKKSGKGKRLRPDTLRGIYEASEILKDRFGKKRILEVTTADMRTYLNGLDVGLRRKFNLRSVLSQFFNWCIAHGHAKENPLTPIQIHVDSDDVTIFSPLEAFNVMKTCQKDFGDLLPYHAISLFAGLRPKECQLLRWDQVHFEEKTITVLGTTSKTKETRNVPIEPTLMSWLEKYRPEKLTGSIIPHRNFNKRNQALHVALGYKGNGKSPDAPDWPQDVMRHSYGSYWLAKFKNRAQLAENMGNTVEMIKRHYKRVVSKSDCTEYWRITPTYDGRAEPSRMPTDDELEAALARKLNRALASE